MLRPYQDWSVVIFFLWGQAGFDGFEAVGQFLDQVFEVIEALGDCGWIG